MAVILLSRSLAVLAAVIAGIAAWLSFATFALAESGARTALLPIDAVHLAIALIAAVAVFAAAWARTCARRVLVALSPLVLVLLPWLPSRVPAACLLWTGPLLSLVWIACAIGVIGIVTDRRPLRLSVLSARVPAARQCAYVAFVSFLLFAAAAWSASPSIPGGDEPHYLVITQSLLYDHDLKIENNHRRGDYHAYFGGTLNPDFVQRGRNGEIYSIHAPGVPALVLPAFAIAGYRGVVVFLLLVASAAAALAWWTAWRVTASTGAAWFGWAAVGLSSPYLVETYTIYPDGPGAAVVLTGFWALLRGEWEAADNSERWTPWFFHGLALATLPWMHTRFSVLAATLGGLVLVRLARTRNPVAKAIAFLAAPAVSALAWLFFFVVIYGTPDPSAPYGRQAQNSFAYLSNGLGGLLFDQGFGLFVAAPAIVFAVAGYTRLRRMAVEYLAVVIPYLLAVATFPMWWAGFSGPARFLVPVLLPLTIPAASLWAAAGRGLRAVMMGALVVGLWLSLVMTAAGGGRLAYHSRDEAGVTAAPWAEWASRAVDLAPALPSYVPQSVGSAIAARQTAARLGTLSALSWALGLAAVILVARRFSRLAAERLTALVTLTSAGAVMACAALVWHVSGAEPRLEASSQLSALRELSTGDAIVVSLDRRRVVAPTEFAGSVTITVDTPSRGRPGTRGNRPLAVLPAIPAGEYSLAIGALEDDGWVMTGIAQDQFAIVTRPLSAVASGMTLRFPVDVRSLVVRADEDARDAIRHITLRPLRLVPPRERLTDGVARRAVRYGSGVVFFLDDRAFAEPSGFWIGGGRSTSVVVAPDTPSRPIVLAVRNAPVENELTIENGRWRDTVPLAPGEERDVSVPLDASRGAALITLQSSSGFRPSEQGGRDTRFLGVFVALR
jgi:hypothetical protein